MKVLGRQCAECACKWTADIAVCPACGDTDTCAIVEMHVVDDDDVED